MYVYMTCVQCEGGGCNDCQRGRSGPRNRPHARDAVLRRSQDPQRKGAAFYSFSLTYLLGGRRGIRPVKTERRGAGVVVCLEQGADLHTAQLTPLPLTVSCFSKIQIGFTFLVPADPGSPGQSAVKRVCVLLAYLLETRQRWLTLWTYKTAANCAGGRCLLFTIFSCCSDTQVLSPSHINFLCVMEADVITYTVL